MKSWLGHCLNSLLDNQRSQSLSRISSSNHTNQEYTVSPEPWQFLEDGVL